MIMFLKVKSAGWFLLCALLKRWISRYHYIRKGKALQKCSSFVGGEGPLGTCLFVGGKTHLAIKVFSQSLLPPFKREKNKKLPTLQSTEGRQEPVRSAVQRGRNPQWPATIACHLWRGLSWFLLVCFMGWRGGTQHHKANPKPDLLRPV